MKTEKKKCTKCDIIKSTSEFYKRGNRKSGFLSACKMCHDKRKQEYLNIPENKAKTNKTRRERGKKYKYEAINHYGGECECCKEKEIDFLVLDHKYGDGNKHRNEVFKGRRGGSMTDWAVRNNFPELFRVLCYNCNQAIGAYGKCPHDNGIIKLEKEKSMNNKNKIKENKS